MLNLQDVHHQTLHLDSSLAGGLSQPGSLIFHHVIGSIGERGLGSDVNYDEHEYDREADVTDVEEPEPSGRRDEAIIEGVNEEL